jgi:hypothetical protein
MCGCNSREKRPIGKFGGVACHGCSDFPKMAVFPFRNQNVAAMAAMASFLTPITPAHIMTE